MKGLGRGGADLREALRKLMRLCYLTLLLTGKPEGVLSTPPPLWEPTCTHGSKSREGAAGSPPGFSEPERNCRVKAIPHGSGTRQRPSVVGWLWRILHEVPVNATPHSVLSWPPPATSPYQPWLHCLLTQACLCHRCSLADRSCLKPWKIIFNYKVTYLEEGVFNKWF